MDSGKNLVFSFLQNRAIAERPSAGNLTSFALKQKQTAVPKIFVLVILTFLLLLSLPAWCFNYIVSLF